MLNNCVELLVWNVSEIYLSVTPQAPIIGELADRLETREKFLAELSDTYGVKKVSNTISGGTTDIKMGNVQAELEARSGASHQSSYHNSMTTGDVSAAGTSGGGPDPASLVSNFDVGVGTKNGQRITVNGSNPRIKGTGEVMFDFTAPERVKEESGTLIDNIKNGKLQRMDYI